MLTAEGKSLAGVNIMLCMIRILQLVLLFVFLDFFFPQRDRSLYIYIGKSAHVFVCLLDLTSTSGYSCCLVIKAGLLHTRQS